MKKLQSLLIILMLTLSGQLFSQQAVSAVNGVVTDNQGTALPGVSVLIKGSNRGTVTDANGHYHIQLQSPNAVLVFSFIGFVVQEVKVGTQTQINIVLQPDTGELQEVVVMGYGTQRKSAVSGVVSTPRPSGNRRKVAAEAIAYECEIADFHQPKFNTEGYTTVTENGFREVLREPLSTFSVDVDRASYANVRRFLNAGLMPPVDAVRIEEMVNYFGYNYPQPKGSNPFSVNSEMAVCPWNANHYLLKVGLQGKEIDKSELPASNLVFLIDVSGSMDSPNKLPLLKSAFGLLLNELRPIDKVAIVVYAGAAGVVLPSTAGNQKQTIMSALDQLNAGGSTAGGAGLKLAYSVAQQNFVTGGNNRIVLATDGDFNVGVSSNAEMERLVESERNNGVFITVLGFGMGNYKDDKMELIADKGNGNYAYIDNMQEAQKTLVREFGGTLFTIAKDVKLQLEFNPSKVAAYRLIGYENRLLNNEDFNNDKKDAGDIGAGHTVTALYEIVPVGADDAPTYTATVDPLKYQKQTDEGTNRFTDEWLTLKLRYKAPDGTKSQLITKEVIGKVPGFESASNDLRFAAGVAAFGMMLRHSENKGQLTYKKTIEMVNNAKGNDTHGDRGELLKLMRLAETLHSSTHIDMAENKR